MRLLLAAPALAELTPAQEKTARGLIKQFSSRRFDERQQAVKTLVEMGPKVIPLVQETLDKTRDNEVKLRCRMVLKGLASKHGATATAKVLAMRKFGYDTSRITINETDAPLPQIVEQLAEQSGNRPLTLHRSVRDRSVTFKVTDLPYWQALDALCRAAELDYSLAYSGAKPVLRRGVGQTTLAGYAGPAVVRVSRAQRSRTQTRNFRVKGKDRNSRILTVSLQLQAEDRLSLVASRASFTKVTTAKGRALKVTPTGGLYSVSGRDPHTGTGSISITGDDAEAAGPLTIEGTAVLEFIVARKSVRIDDIFAEGVKRVEADGTSIALTDASRTGTLVKLSMDFKSPLKVHQKLLDRRTGEVGFRLVDPNGKTHNTVTLVSRVGSLSGEKPSKLKFTFSVVPEIDGVWSLEFVYPSKTAKRTYPFRIENIPLP